MPVGVLQTLRVRPNDRFAATQHSWRPSAATCRSPRYPHIACCAARNRVPAPTTAANQTAAAMMAATAAPLAATTIVAWEKAPVDVLLALRGRPNGRSAATQ